jgi:hypothetical protein
LMSTPSSSTSSKRKLQLQPSGLTSPSVSQPEVLDADSDVSGEHFVLFSSSEFGVS